MAKYTSIIYMKSDKFDKVNKLLEIPSFEDLTDEEMRKLGANTNYNENIFEAKFDDGSIISYDLCSGENNYYDNIMWTSPDGREEFIDCCFELYEQNEVEIESNIYVVKIIKE